MKKIVFFALVSVLLLNLAIASHGKALKQSDLPNLVPKLQRVIAEAGIKRLLAEDIVQSGKMEGQISPKLIGFDHIALDPFSDNEVCMTVDFIFGEQQGVLSLLFRWIGISPILVNWSYWLVNTEVSDDIHEDTTWTSEGSPYYVTMNVHINSGATLTIQPGTVVRFRKFTNPQEHIYLRVCSGESLLSEGATFTTSCDFENLDEIQSMGWESSDWQGIQKYGHGNIIVDQTILEYANWAIDTWQREDEIIVSNSMFRKCQGGVSTWGWSSVTVTNNIISDCWDRAIYVDFQGVSDVGGDITGNMITMASGWTRAAMEIRHGIPNISDNEITGSFHNGIYTEWLEASALIMDNEVNIPDWADNGIYAHGGECTISGNEVTGSFDLGIGVDSVNGMVTSNVITSSDWSWTGIAAWDGDCKISDNEVIGSFEHGIMLESFHGGVAGNTIISPPGSSWACIAAWHGEKFLIGENYIEGYFDIGIFVENVGSQVIVDGNTIIGQRTDPVPIAINIDGGEPTVDANIISGEFSQIIRVVAESNAIITNHCLRDDYGIYSHYGVYCVNSEPVIDNNDIVGNTECGVYNETPDGWTVYAENNWWGHDTGPYHPELNPNGQGDCVSDSVAFDPWLPGPVCP